MRKLIAVGAFLYLAGSSTIAYADLPGPRLEQKEKKRPEAPEPAPVEEDGVDDEDADKPSADTGDAPAEVDAAVADGDEPAAKAEPKPAEAKTAAPPAAKAEPKAEPKPEAKSGNCSVQTEDNALFGFAALAFLLSGAALRRRSPSSS